MLELDFANETRPELVKVRFQLRSQTKAIEKTIGSRGNGNLPWSPALIAFSAFFLRYKLWGLTENRNSEFVYESDPVDNIVGSLANALEKPTWIEEFFGYDGNSAVYKMLFRGRNRSGKDKQKTRIVSINQEFLPPEKVHIRLQSRTPKSKSLVRFIDLVEKQWTSHKNSSPPVSSSSEQKLVGPVECFPFEHIDSHARCFRNPKLSIGRDPRPSFDEFREGCIYVHPRIPIVAARLKQERWCAIDGFPTTGKTTAALQIAVNHGLLGGDAFYLDLSEYTEAFAPQIAEFTARHKQYPEGLLLIDNAEANPSIIKHVLNVWRAGPAKAQLLIVGNLTIGKTKNELAMLHDSSVPVIWLYVREPEIAGVFSSATKRLGRHIELGGDALTECHLRFNQDLKGLVQYTSNRFAGWQMSEVRLFDGKERSSPTAVPHFFGGMNRQAPEVGILRARILETPFEHLIRIIQSQFGNKRFLQRCKQIFAEPVFAQQFAVKSAMEPVKSIVDFILFSVQLFDEVCVRALFLALLNRQPGPLVEQMTMRLQEYRKSRDRTLRFVTLCENWMDGELRSMLFARIGSPSQINLSVQLLKLCSRSLQPLNAFLQKKISEGHKAEIADVITVLKHPICWSRLISRFRHVPYDAKDIDEFLSIAHRNLSREMLSEIRAAIELRNKVQQSSTH